MMVGSGGGPANHSGPHRQVGVFLALVAAKPHRVGPELLQRIVQQDARAGALLPVDELHVRAQQVLHAPDQVFAGAPFAPSLNR